MTRFYTKTGDDGYTGLLGAGRAAKNDPIIELIGVMDEVNAAIGLARSMSQSEQTSTTLIIVQKDLYQIMTEIAVLPENTERFSKLSSDRTVWLESQIDTISNQVATPSEFIIPGDTQAGGAIDLARTITRRAERAIVQAFHQNLISNPELLRYFNRLSSLCFILELLENQVGGHPKSTLVKG